MSGRTTARARPTAAARPFTRWSLEIGAGGALAEEARRSEHQDHDQHGEPDELLELRRHVGLREAVDDPEDDAARDGARDAAEATEHDDDERPQDRQGAGLEVEAE